MKANAEAKLRNDEFGEAQSVRASERYSVVVGFDLKFKIPLRLTLYSYFKESFKKIRTTIKLKCLDKMVVFVPLLKDNTKVGNKIVLSKLKYFTI